jgi:hypothetical protein
LIANAESANLRNKKILKKKKNLDNFSKEVFFIAVVAVVMLIRSPVIVGLRRSLLFQGIIPKNSQLAESDKVTRNVGVGTSGRLERERERVCVRYGKRERERGS